MTEEEKRREKARSLRYKKPLMSNMSLWFIRESIDEMQEVISEVKWFAGDMESLVSAMDGDQDEACEFQMAFSDLDAELDRFREDLDDAWLPECFDELFAATLEPDMYGGMMGYDAYEGDYYGLKPYEYGFAAKEAEKRIRRLTKQGLLEAVGACLKVYAQFVAIRYRYDCLEASLDILRAQNIGILKAIKAIEAQYEKAEEESSHFKYDFGKAVWELDRMVSEIPQQYWIW